MDKRKSSIGFTRQKTYFAILDILVAVQADKKYPDVLLGGLFKEGNFSSPEKARIVEFVYGILRHRGKIDYVIANASNARISELDINITSIIRICTYQALFTDSTPAGILSNATALCPNGNKFAGFVKRTVEAVLRNKGNVIFPDKEKSRVDYISVYHSHPSWIVKKWLAEFQEPGEVEELCRANNLDPPLTIRSNPLKTDPFDLQNSLKDEGYPSSTTAFSPFGLVVNKKENIFKTEAFRNGLFEVQDEGSQLITLLAGAKPGEFVIDACAGNGGKSLFLAGLMKNHGTIVAFETHASKLANLRRRAGRAGATNIQTAGVDELQQYNGKADCVFIDAPCSGMGVFRRNPDSKWRLAADDIKELAAKQKEILMEYSRLVKPGGRLVYATCTISREENEDIVREFLIENRGFSQVPVSGINTDLFGKFTIRDGFFRSLPHIHNTDGFFAAVMRCIGSD